jgi:hypothetical protein
LWSFSGFGVLFVFAVSWLAASEVFHEFAVLAAVGFYVVDGGKKNGAEVGEDYRAGVAEVDEVLVQVHVGVRM